MNDSLSIRLRQLNSASFVAVMLLASFLIVLPLGVLAEFFPALARGSGPASMASNGIAVRLIFGVVVAPLVETALLQTLPLRIARGWLRWQWPAAILASTLLFGAWHSYSVGYVLFGAPVGLVLAYAYALRSEPLRRPFLTTSAIHALRNTFAVFLL